MKLDVDVRKSRIDQRYLEKMRKDASVKEVNLAGGLQGVYNSLRHWGRVIDPQTMTLVAEVSTPIVFNEEHQESYLPRFKQDYFVMAGFELAE